MVRICLLSIGMLVAALVPGTVFGLESIDAISLVGMPSSAGCAQPSPLCFQCDTFNITVKWNYHTSEAPVTYKTHIWIYEDDWPSSNEVLGSWTGDVMYSYVDSETTLTFTNVAIGVETCADAGGIGNKGEFYARVWIESASWDEDENSSTYYVTDSSGALVEITEMHLEPGNGNVSISWDTSLEQDNAGWNIYRSSAESEVVKINSEIIPAYQYQYSITDGPVSNGEIVYYYIEDVGTDGLSTRHYMGWAMPSPTDFDGSYRIDGQDLIFLSASIGSGEEQVGSWAFGDVNEDGTIDEYDWHMFSDYYGHSTRRN